MPPGTPYNSFVKPYPIRVDEFSVPRDGSLTVAALHLLTHTHSDHIIGLNSKSFGSIIICSEDAKEMLLRHETYQARFLREEDYVYEKQRTFEHLKFPMQASNEVFKRNEFDLIKEAVSGLIDLMKAYPVHMRFFINVWTWGYEDILKAVSQAFESKIHVDRYKNDVYSSLSDRDLRALITQDYRSTRFHACERFARCDLVRNEDPGVVYINPVNISSDNWDLYLAKTKAMMERGALPMLLLVPLHRHSTLPELQNFVGLFRPRRLVPNFLEPSLHGLDWACM
ncbi:uncharacterized protein FOMMEDRAFT_42871, partial [Fomitiporia mediterranea MF3/22]|uniref:uncharacterized protein n=1 Tax=Fomitiporia mediterranea (strain MF3/22) TaxID=694068 RepID=UPI0004408575